MLCELTCTECSISFSSAASLLKHFAQHASQVILQPEENKGQNNSTNKKTNIPGLYPISSIKSAFKHSKSSKDAVSALTSDCEENVDSGIEDLVNPLRYCAVSMEHLSAHNEPTHSIEKFKNRCIRKYKCTYCSKTFGWSTDLKRHTLTHTGERPFKCSLCDSTFTRKFLLQKHQAKQHSDVGYDIVHSAMLGNKIKIPPLKPIGFILKRKSRKQDKQKIKRKVLNTKNLYQSVNDCFEVADNLVCST